MGELKLKVKDVAEAQGIRDAAGLSRRADVAYATAHRLWRGDLGDDKKGIGINVLHRVARALGVRLMDLLEETPGQRVPRLASV